MSILPLQIIIYYLIKTLYMPLVMIEKLAVGETFPLVEIAWLH